MQISLQPILSLKDPSLLPYILLENLDPASCFAPILMVDSSGLATNFQTIGLFVLEAVVARARNISLVE